MIVEHLIPLAITWKVEVIAGALGAILNHEVTIRTDITS